MNVYIVYLHTGSWESYRYIILKIFSNKISADNYANSLRERLDAIGWHTEGNCHKAKEASSRLLRINYYEDPVIFEDEPLDFPGGWITVSEPIKVEE